MREDVDQVGARPYQGSVARLGISQKRIEPV
jgi:hypothetical protein